MTYSPIEVRKYGSEAEFTTDAPAWAAAGYRIAAQSQGSAVSNAGSWTAAIGILIAIGGLIAYFPLVILGIVVTIVGAALRDQTYTVTYQAGP